jgi:hypothetical protein
MEIEDTIERKKYRGFELVHLRLGKTGPTRWHITRKEGGMTRNYGFVSSEDQAHRQIDELIDDDPKRMKPPTT